VVVGASVVVVEVGTALVVVGASVVVVLVGDAAAALPHGSGSQVPGPMSMPPFVRQARGLFTRHFVAPLAAVRQHWIGPWRPAETGSAPARRSVQAKMPSKASRTMLALLALFAPGRGALDMMLSFFRAAHGARLVLDV